MPSLLFGDLKDKRKTINLGDPDLVTRRRRREDEERGRESLGGVYERTVLKLFRKKDK